MGRSKELKDPVHVGCELEKTHYEELEKIRWREHMDRAEVLRLAVHEYIERHAAGNEVFKLDEWQSDSGFVAIPATMSSKEKWSKFIRGEMSKEERMELDKIAEHIRAEIDAKNWLDSRK